MVECRDEKTCAVQKKGDGRCDIEIESCGEHSLAPSKSNAQSEASCARPVKWLQEDGWSWFERGADKK